MNAWGSPGFGKTSVATAVGHQLDSQGFPVLLLSLRGVKTLKEMARQMLNMSQQTNQGSFDQTPPTDRVLQWISSISSPLFLILDNADDLLRAQKEEFVQYLQNIIKSCKKVKLLCTTRASLEYVQHLFDTFLMRIPPLDKSSSRKLIRAFLPKVTDSDSETIGQICGNVPLAIRLVCSMLNDGDLSLEDLASTEVQFLEAVDKPDYPDDLRLKILFEQCFQSLPNEDQEAFVCLSVFNSSFDVPAAVAILGTKGKVAGLNVLGKLKRKSLLDHNDTCNYSIHPLLQSFGEMIGREEKKTVFQDAKLRFYRYYLDMFKKLNEQFHAEQSSLAYQQFQTEQQNFVKVLEGINNEDACVLSMADIFLDCIYWNDDALYQKTFDAAISACQQQKDTLNQSQLLVAKAFAHIPWSSGESEVLLSEAQKLQESLHSIPAEVKGKLQCYQGIDSVVRGKTEEGVKLLKNGYCLLKNNPVNLSIKVLTFQILALCDSDMPDSLESFDKLMHGQDEKEVPHVPAFSSFICGDNSKLSTKTLKEVQPFVLQTVYLLNKVCESLTVVKGKQRLAKYVLEIQRQMKESFGEDVHLNPLYTTASKILYHLGCYKEALKSQNETLAMRKKLSGQHLSTAQSLHEVGRTQYMLEEYKNAMQSHTKALAMRKKLLGKQHVDIARSLHELGETQYMLKEYKNAMQSHTKALAMRKKLLGKQHVDTARSLYELGGTQYKLEDYQNALQSHKEALAIRKKLLGKEHVDTARSLYELGWTQYELENYQNALHSHKEALAIRKKLFGNQHVDTARSLYELGWTQYKLGDYQNALQSHKQALAIRKKLLREKHVDIARSLYSLGCTQHKLGDLTDALDSFHKALEVELGDHENTASTYDGLALTLDALDRHDRAHETREKSQEMRRRLKEKITG